ncbi:MAG: hypothetical protein K2X81_16630 [Candidatus Obscuribacterales bacterium]|nr:hypothetical protein [Candidatus Obscuribacterales bacterium]
MDQRHIKAQRFPSQEPSNGQQKSEFFKAVTLTTGQSGYKSDVEQKGLADRAKRNRRRVQVRQALNLSAKEINGIRDEKPKGSPDYGRQKAQV